MESNHMDELALLKAEYAQALARNAEAKARLQQLHQGRGQAAAWSAPRSSSNRDHLTAHLENLRLQRQYSNLQTVAHYSDQAEKIATDEQLYEPLDVSRSNTGSDSLRTNRGVKLEDLATSEKRVDALLNSAKTLTTNLELALVKARQELKAEQSSLEYAKAQSNHIHHGRHMGAKLNALQAIRDELQTWIGDSLAACEQEVILPDAVLSAIAQEDGLDRTKGGAEADVVNEYERYIEARERLLAATSALTSQLPTMAGARSEAPNSKETNTRSAAKDWITAIQRPHDPRHKSKASVSRVDEHSTTPALAELQSTTLEEYHHERTLSRYATHLEDQTLTQDARLLQILNLLSHESHLLPAYPLPISEQSREKGASTLNDQQVAIDRWLRAWAFASDRSGEALESSVQSHVQDARGALAKARVSVGEMHIVGAMRKEAVGKS